MSSDIHQRVVKLKGRENYDTWKIAAKSYLIIKELWICIEKEPEANKPKEIERDQKAWSELSLLIHESVYSYIANTDTAKAASIKLEKSFEDSGLCRKVELLKQLVQMTLETCASVEDYVNKMLTTSLKVQKAGLVIDDELLASLMLAGLPNHYLSLVMAIENSTAHLTSDGVKTILLQDPRLNSHKQRSGAYSVRSKPAVFKFRCHKCGEFGHMAKFCEHTDENPEKSSVKQKNEENPKVNYVHNNFQSGF